MADVRLLPEATQISAAPPRIGLLEKTLAVAGLLVLMGVLRAVGLGEQSDRTAGSALFQLVSGGIYLSALGAMLIRGIPAWVFQTLARCWPLILLTLLALVSALWSQAPDTSLRRAVALILSSSFAVFFIARLDLRTIVALLAVAFAIYLALSIAAAAIPGFGIVTSGSYAGAWRGIGGHKNSFGRTVALAAVLLPVAAALGLVSFRRMTALLGLVAVALLFLSRSATSLVAAFGGMSLGVLFYAAFGGPIGRIRLHPAAGAALLASATIAIGLILIFAIPTITALLGRDPTLTGRTELWAWAIGLNEDRALLGSGYRTFWIDENTKYFFTSFTWHEDEEDTTTGFHGPSHSHSGYVDTYVELGWIGVVCFALVIVSAFVVIRKAIACGASEAGLLFSLTMAFLLVYATAANSILQHSEDLWFLFSMFYLMATKEYVLASKELSSRTWARSSLPA
jgi:O-antigen ligase